VKLLTKYNRTNLITTIIVLLVSSITYYFIIRGILITQIDKDLKVEEQEIHEYVNENHALPMASNYKGQEIKFEVAKTNNIKREIESSSLFRVKSNEEKPVRILTFPITVDGILYKAIVIKSQVETEDLLKLIVLITAAIFLLFLVIISLMNRLLLARLWQPFYHTLEQLKSFNLRSSNKLELSSTNLEEFSQLNSSVLEMTKRISNEFEALRSFTDNASHEMQTPLAIINSKLDLLLQNSSEKQVEQLQAVYDATGRLTRLNKTLLLLTKIDNEQYKNSEKINLKLLLEQKFQQFEELIKGKNLKLTYKLEDANVILNKELADILLNNLLSNAIQHNYSGGHIHCSLTKEEFSISNSGPALTFSEQQIFERFQKSDHSNGTGLGLAVVNQICESSHINIRYAYSNGEHTFSIKF